MVVPLLDPSTSRDAVGDMIGVVLNPLMWVGVSIPGLGVLFAVNGRAQADEQIETAKRAALDYYVFARDAYVQSDGEGNWWDDSPIGAEPSDELYEVKTETDLELTVDPEPASSGTIEATQ
jgi:ABC-type transporter lipoprotein component MlaA